MNRRLWYVASCLSASLLLSGRSAACPESLEYVVLGKMESFFTAASIVASAKVLWARSDPGTGRQTAQFEVEKVFKGTVSNPLVIEYTLGMCMGVGLPVGKRVYLFLGHEGNPELRTRLNFVRHSLAPPEFAARLARARAAQAAIPSDR